MFKDLGAIMSLLNNREKIREEFEKLQQITGQITAEATAGGDMVTVKVNGRMEMLTCRISDEALAMNDKEMVEDLIVAATNQAMVKAKAKLAEESSKMAENMGLPPGMLGGGGFPGFPG